MQDEDRSIVDRQPGESPVECVGVSRSVVQTSFGRRRFSVVEGIEQPDLADTRSTSPAELSPAGVQVDPSEPGVEEVRVAQVRVMAPGRDEGLVRGVGGVGGIPQDGERCAVHGIDPAADEGIEGIAILCAGS
jgi:hypothetical protein